MSEVFTPMDRMWMKRCFHLARMAGKNVVTNPQVGAVLVYRDRIIGEGFHERFGEAHAEVNAISSVEEKDKKYISQATLYVSLEPCCHSGKTPACTGLIIASGIRKVVISATDPNPQVSGKGISVLKDKGIEVKSGLLRAEGRILISSFVAQLNKRPAITLKIAQSSDNFMGQAGKQVWITNPYSQVESHHLRTVNDAILVGNRTILTDDPQLNTRWIKGDSPIRIVLDKNGKIKEAGILSDGGKTWIVTQNPEAFGRFAVPFDFSKHGLADLMHLLYEKGIYRLLVEGGPTTINSFLKEKLWDKAVIFKASKRLNEGLKSPNIEGRKGREIIVGNDVITEVFRIKDRIL